MARPSKYTDSREKKEGRNFECILYDDDPDIEYKLNRLQYFWNTFYYIKHDKDVWTAEEAFKWELENDGKKFPHEVGSPKKAHYHCIGVSCPILLGLAATKFDVASNLVQRVKSLKAAIRYLIHLDNPEKHQYLPEEIITNDPKVNDYLKNEVSSSQKARMLIEAIYSQPVSTFYDLSIYAISNDLWDELRRGQHLYSQLLIEHNRKVARENENYSNRTQEN